MLKLKNRNIPKLLTYGSGIVMSVIILLIFIIVAACAVPNVFQLKNLTNILRVNSAAGIMAIGLALVLLTGEIDISVGAIMSLTMMIASKIIDFNEIFTMIAIIIVGGLCGLINSLIITKLKVPSLMVTIGTMSIYSGLASIIVNGQTKFITEAHPIITSVAKGAVFDVPNTFIICIIVAFLCWLLTSKTQFGRSIYYTGANKRAAWMSGINIDKVKIIVFVICGVLAAISGLLITAQIGRAKSDVGTGYEATAIAIAVLGGVSLDGGKGSILGVLCGMGTMGLLINMLALSRMGTYAELAMKGVLIISTVYLYGFVNRRAH